jgi:uncharacterized membrane protein (DUF2068 family)
MDWSLLSCGRHGHVTYAPDEPELREQLRASVGAAEAWQCLRCGAYVPGPAATAGPADQAPLVPRGREIRSKVILRVFAVERVIRALVFLVAAYTLWHYRHSQHSLEHAFDRELSSLHGVLGQFGYSITNSKLVGLLRHALTLSTQTLTLLAAGAVAYAVIELVEAVGLWTARRWGEYFAMVATSVGLPLEIYDLTRKVTATTIVLLIINLALVVYLAVTKRLFGIRGGKIAYDARLREESVLEAARVAAGREHGGHAAGATAVGAAGSATAESPDAPGPESSVAAAEGAADPHTATR